MTYNLSERAKSYDFANTLDIRELIGYYGNIVSMRCVLWYPLMGRVTVLETKLETELRHLSTKADLEQVKADLERAVWRLGGLIILAVSVGVAVLKIWG